MKEMTERNKPIIYFSGGTMQGIFGAGVVSALEQHDVYNKLGAVYGASAGSLVGAYFLAQQSTVGTEMMLNDLTSGKFISPKKFFLGIFDRLIYYYFRAGDKEMHRNAIDIPYLFSCVEHTRKLDVAVINARDIPFYVKVLNMNNRTIEYHDARGPHLLSWLRASVDVHPYTTETQMISGTMYADAAVKSVIGIDILRERHPDTQIIIVLNSHEKRRYSQLIKNRIEAYFTSIGGDSDIAPLYRSAEYVVRDELSRITQMGDVHLFAIPDDIPIRSRTTDLDVLARTHHAGYKAGKRIASLLSD